MSLFRLSGAGEDATDEFNALHSAKARGMLDDYYIGDLESDSQHTDSSSSKQQVSSPQSASTASVSDEETEQLAPAALNPKKKLSVKLIEREELTANTRRLRFALPTPKHRLGLPVGKHLFVSGKWKGEFVMRAYTPTTGDEPEALGHVDLVIKVYYPCDRFPEGGKMSQLLDSLAIGDSIDMKGPLGEIVYEGRSHFAINEQPRIGRKLAMMGGGTGITPLYAVAKAILADLDDLTQIWMLLANNSENDILMRRECDALAAAHPDRFQVHYTISKCLGDATQWTSCGNQSTGRICETMMRTSLPPAGEDVLAFMCGPPGMLNCACIPNLRKLGYSEQHYFAF